MILVTVGAQMPFDRLVGAVDEWAGARRRGDVLAQIGTSEQIPRHLEWVRFLPPDDLAAAYRDAELVIAHAGTGSILSALELGTPIVVMPRRAALGETRNDHQVATAKRFAALAGVPVAWDERELPAVLDRIGPEGARLPQVIGPYASDRLLGTIREFLAR